MYPMCFFCMLMSYYVPVHEKYLSQLKQGINSFLCSFYVLQAMAAVNTRKQVYVLLKGPFSEKGINEYLRQCIIQKKKITTLYLPNSESCDSLFLPLCMMLHYKSTGFCTSQRFILRQGKSCASQRLQDCHHRKNRALGW